MIRFITLLIGCSLTLAAGALAKQPEEAKKDAAKKPKNVQKQQVAPKQQQLKAPKVHTDKNANVPKHSFRMAPPMQPNTPANVQSNKIQKNKPQLETSTRQQQLQDSQLNQQQLNKKSAKTYLPRHQNFHARPKSSVVSVQFNKNYQISAARNWNGANYQVYRSYRPQWRDQGWWRLHYNRLSLISGGWYYWDGGYWYPAWGYDNSAAYYPYDGPIYSGPNAAPLDQVVADVQSALQEQGYYKGEVDGLLGPLTRQALAEYQQANGLYATQTIDQPTLQSLGLG